MEGAKKGNGRIISLLLAAGADVKLGIRGNFPLHGAISCIRPFQSMKLLLRVGADVNQTDSDGLTPLHLAVCEKRLFLENIRQNIHKYRTPDRILLEVVCVLLEAGVQINKKDLEGRNALVTAISYSKSEDHLKLCKLLYAVGETLDKSDEDKIPEYFKELRNNNNNNNCLFLF